MNDLKNSGWGVVSKEEFAAAHAREQAALAGYETSAARRQEVLDALYRWLCTDAFTSEKASSITHLTAVSGDTDEKGGGFISEGVATLLPSAADTYLPRNSGAADDRSRR